MPSARTAAWLLPALAAMLLFLPVLGADFVHDDQTLLRDNPNIRTWEGVATGFSAPFWHIADDPRTHVGGFYRPLGVTAFVVLHQVGGGSPWPYHAMSLALHGLAAALLGLLALRLGWKPLAAGAAGMVFALHGMHVEPVAWASSLTYLMAAAFALGGLLALFRGRGGLAALLLAGAMLSQEAGIGVWLLALGLTVFRGDVEPAQRRRNLLALAGAGLLVYLLRCWVFGDLAAGFFGRPITDLSVPASELWGISFASQFQELRYLVWPWPHAPFRPLPSPESVTLADPQRWLPALGGLLFLVTASVWWLRGARRWSRQGAAPPLLLPIGLVLAGLLPLLSVSNLGQFPFEERFVYLPSAGFALIAGWLLGRFPKAWWPGVPLLAFHAWSASTTIGAWADDASFFAWGKQASPNTMLPFTESGRLLLNEAASLPPGHPQRIALAEEAQKDFKAALDISSGEWVVTQVDRMQGNLGLATSLYYQGSVDAAEDLYRRILDNRERLRDWPGMFQAHHGLGACLAERADAALQQGDEILGRDLLEQALVQQIAASEGAPEWDAPQHAQGLVLLRLGREQEALELLRAAFERDPSRRAYRFDLAQAYWNAGRIADFNTLIREGLALESAPAERASILFQVGALHLDRSQSQLQAGPEAFGPPLEQAMEYFRRSLLEHPGGLDANHGMAVCYDMLGLPAEALEFARIAFNGRPASFPFAQTYFRLLLLVGRAGEARQILEVWAQAAPDDHPEMPEVIQQLKQMPVEDGG